MIDERIAPPSRLLSLWCRDRGHETTMVVPAPPLHTMSMPAYVCAGGLQQNGDALNAESLSGERIMVPSAAPVFESTDRYVCLVVWCCTCLY